MHRNADGSYLVMSDNGFGAKANSPDFELRVHRIVPDENELILVRLDRPLDVARGIIA